MVGLLVVWFCLRFVLFGWLVVGFVLYYWFGIGCLLIGLIAADLCSSVVASRLRCCGLFGCAAV